MYLQQMRLKDIACFEDVTLDFTRPGTDQACSWVVLLGENGTGKSTILKMLGLALLGRELVLEVVADMQWEQLVRSSAKCGRVEATIVRSTSDRKPRSERTRASKQYRLAFDLGRTIKTRLREVRDETFDFAALDATLYAETLTGGWFACGYGSWRKLPALREPHQSSLTQARRSSKPYRFVTLFQPDAALTRVVDWLVELEFQRLKEQEEQLPPERQVAVRYLDLAKQALAQVLYGATFKEITRDREVIFEEHGIAIPIDRLSDGYQSVTVLIIDLLRRLVEAFPDNNHPLSAKGVVLIDEIDIHLHPKWQRSIVEQIRGLFPNLQFIITSHSPFIAQDMRPEDKIIVLKKHNGNVTVHEDAGFVTSWRVDQILTSSLFDMNTTRNVHIAAAEQEYQHLLDLRASGTFTSENKQRLSDLKQWLDEHRSAPGETADENELYNAAQSLLDILDDYTSH